MSETPEPQPRKREYETEERTNPTAHRAGMDGRQNEVCRGSLIARSRNCDGGVDCMASRTSGGSRGTAEQQQ